MSTEKNNPKEFMLIMAGIALLALFLAVLVSSFTPRFFTFSSGALGLGRGTGQLGRIQPPRPGSQPPVGAQTYQIMEAEGVYPKFVEAAIDPLDVQPRQTQKMKVVLEDSADIASVIAEIQTDNGTKTVPLARTSKSPVTERDQINNYSLSERSESKGVDVVAESILRASRNLSSFLFPLSSYRANAAGLARYVYEGSWLVTDTHARKYRTTFRAQDAAGRKNAITLTWSDAICSFPAGGNWTLNRNCSVTGVSGVDNGNITLNNSNYTLTLQPNATFAFNPGKSITITAGAIAIGSGAQIKKTYLWMTDADQDGFSPDLVQYAQDTAPANGRRRYLMNDLYAADCADSDANTNPGQVAYFTYPGGNGWDYNCDGVAEKEFTNLASISCGPSPTCQTYFSPGWSSTNPGCGSSAYYGTDVDGAGCYYFNGGCESGFNVSVLTQACR